MPTESGWALGSAQATIPGQPPPLPAPIIVKFSSPHIRLAFLLNKRASLPTVSDVDKLAGVKYYSASEDLTSPTYKKLITSLLGPTMN